MWWPHSSGLQTTHVVMRPHSQPISLFFFSFLYMSTLPCRNNGLRPATAATRRWPMEFITRTPRNNSLVVFRDAVRRKSPFKISPPQTSKWDSGEIQRPFRRQVVPSRSLCWEEQNPFFRSAAIFKSVFLHFRKNQTPFEEIDTGNGFDSLRSSRWYPSPLLWPQSSTPVDARQRRSNRSTVTNLYKTRHW